MTKTYIVLDVEHRIDTEGHLRYLAAERYTPEQAQQLDRRDAMATPRWPFRRPVAASWLVLALDRDRVLTPVRIQTVGCPEQDERQLLSMLWADIASIGMPAEIVTWGGVVDMPQMLLAMMAHGLTLPASHRPLADPFNARARHHRDLMLAVGGAAARVHMSEVAAALDIPAKPIAPPGAVAGFITAGKWSSVKAVAEADVFTTALILVRHLRLGEPSATTFAASHRIAAFAAARTFRDYAATFAAYRDRLVEEATAEAHWAHAALAA